MLSNKRHFAYNLLSSYGNTIISVIFSFISVPIALNYWGTELYGVWTIITSFVTYINATGLGIDSATGCLMTKNNGLIVKINILKKGVKLLILCSIVAACILFLLTYFFPNWFKIIGKMDEKNYPIVKISTLIFFVSVIINLPFSAISNSLVSFGKAYIGSLMGIFQTVLQFIIIVLTASFSLSFPFYIGLISFNTLFFNIIKLFIVILTVNKRKLTNNIEDEDLSEDNNYKSILKMGINMSLYGIVILLVPNFSNLIISNNIDVEALVPYSFSYKLFALATGLIANINAAASPLMGAEFGKKNWTWIKQTHKKIFEITIPLSIFIVLGVIWLGRPFITLWTGSADNYVGDIISVILGIYFFSMTMHNFNLVIINTFNYTKNNWIISFADGIIFLIVSFFLIKHIGIMSVPIGLTLGSYLISIWAYPVLVYHRSNKQLVYDIKYLTKNLVIFFCSIGIYLIISKLNLSFMYSIFFCCIGMIVSSLVIYIILPKEIKCILLSKFRRTK